MKSFTVNFSPVAIDDVEQTVSYYEKQQPGLGKRFAAQLQLTLNAINRSPFFASVRYDIYPDFLALVDTFLAKIDTNQ